MQTPPQPPFPLLPSSKSGQNPKEKLCSSTCLKKLTFFFDKLFSKIFFFLRMFWNVFFHFFLGKFLVNISIFLNYFLTKYIFLNFCYHNFERNFFHKTCNSCIFSYFILNYKLRKFWEQKFKQYFHLRLWFSWGDIPCKYVWSYHTF